MSNGYNNDKRRRATFSFSKTIFVRVVICLSIFAVVVRFFTWNAAPPRGNIRAPFSNLRRKKTAFVCITGQIERLELDSKISAIFQPLKRRFDEVSVIFLLTEGHVAYTNKGHYSTSQLNMEQLALMYPAYIFKRVQHIPNPPINNKLFTQLNKAWFTQKSQRRRAENHYRQYNTLSQCYDSELPSYDIIVRVREDVFVHNINWDEIIHKLDRDGPVITTPDYAEWNGINDKIAFLNQKAAATYFTHPLSRYHEAHPQWVQNPETYYYHIYDDARIFLDSTDSVEIVTTRYDSEGKLQLHGVSPEELQIVEKIEHEQNPWKFVDCITVINLKTHKERAVKFMMEAERAGLPNTIEQQWEDLDPDGGTAGCFRAHVRAVQNAYDNQCDNVLVFEPDTYFHGDYQKAFRDMDRFLASGDYYDVFFLGHYPISRMHPTEYDGIYRSFSSFHGHARMVSRPFMKKMRVLEYNGIHLDNQLALMRPWTMTVYPMVAFQHAHHSDVSPFKNTRSEANEEDLRMKLVNAEQEAATKGRLCYMSKANPEGKTMSPKERSELCTWTRKYIWFYTDRPNAYLNQSTVNLRIEKSDVNQLHALQYRTQTSPADIYLFDTEKFQQLSKSTEGLEPKVDETNYKVISSSLPIIHHYVDTVEKSPQINLQLAVKSTVYEIPKCKSKYLIWNGLLSYHNTTMAKQILTRKWLIHPRYELLDWSNDNWLTIRTPDHYSHMLLFSLRPLLPLFWVDRKVFELEIWRFYTSCKYTCRHQLGSANTHAASFRIMVNVLTQSPREFLVEDVKLLINYPKKTKNNHVLAEAMALILAGNVLKKPRVADIGLNRFIEIFYWYSHAYHIHSDGVVDEGSPFYQLYVLDQVVQIRQYIQCWTDLEIDSTVESSVKNMALYSYATTLDQGCLFPFGTTSRRRPFGKVGEGVVTEDSYSLIQDMYPITSKSYHAEKVGHWILHTTKWHVFFNYAVSKFNSHRDFDALSIMIATNKEGLWLSDPGPFARQGDKEWEAERAEHFSATKHHNTVTIDGKDQPPKSGKLVYSDSHAITASFLTHTRRVEVNDEEIIIVDTMNPQDNEMHTYQQTWHLDPEVRVEGNKLWKGRSCILVISSHALEIQQAKHSYDYHQSVTTNELIIIAIGKNTATLNTRFKKCKS